MKEKVDINTLRGKIDELDTKILELINERANYAKKIGELKEDNNLPIFAPEREYEIYNKIKKLNNGPLEDRYLINIYREIISACRSAQNKLRVAYLGPPGTFTNLAAIKYFGLSAEFISIGSIEEVFEEVERGKATYGIIPIENSLEGVVTHAIDMFFDTKLKICSEIYIKVKHNLINKTGNIEDIKKIYSHPQAIAQCKKFLSSTVNDIPIIEVESTAKAALIAAKDISAAAIASEAAVLLYDLKVVCPEIQDSLNNYTRFFVIGRDVQPFTGYDKTSIMFSVPHKAGALFNALDIFAKYDINMSKIESRPSKREAWKYVFFVDIDGHIDCDTVKEALEELSKKVNFIKILGSYRKGEMKDV
ncbi:MAG: prephenate dehydratase [Deferribacterota bacterium]|nr:prephenate dehydratase [Deferribacterota bacterium]